MKQLRQEQEVLEFMVGIKDRRWLSNISLSMMMIFFYLPIVIMIVFSFNESRSLSVFQGFSFNWYQQLLNSRDVVDAVWVSVSIAVIATTISTFVGTLTAIGLSKSKKILRDVYLVFNDFPVMNPEIVTAIGWMLLFVVVNLTPGYLTMLLAHIAFCTPYVILSILPKLRALDPNITEAAMDLGATPTQALWQVIVPQIVPGIISGALIAFTMSIDDFVISYFVTGNGVKNISILVYNMSKRINPMINALSTIMVVVIAIILILINVVPILKEGGKKNEKVFD